MRASKAAWGAYVADRASGIDYDNSKNAVVARQGSWRARIYGDVRSVLLRLRDAGGTQPG